MLDSKTDGLISDITRHLAGIFRHMLPGVLVISAARLAYPHWFDPVDLKSWQHLAILAILTVAVGNTWFALNRYGLHQTVDYVLYRKGWGAPAKTATSKNYLDDLGQYVSKSQHAPDSSARAQEHVAFRASTVLLILTLGEVCVVFGIFHSIDSPLEGRELRTLLGGAVALVIGFWQMAITRFIDGYVVNQ